MPMNPPFSFQFLSTLHSHAHYIYFEDFLLGNSRLFLIGKRSTIKDFFGAFLCILYGFIFIYNLHHEAIFLSKFSLSSNSKMDPPPPQKKMEQKLILCLQKQAS